MKGSRLLKAKNHGKPLLRVGPKIPRPGIARRFLPKPVF